MRREIYILYILASLTITLLSCAPPRPIPLDFSQVRKSIEAQNAKWVDAIKNNETITLTSLYTDDATVMPPNDRQFKGKQDVKAFYDEIALLNQKVTEASFVTVDVGGQDSSAFETGIYTITVQPPNQAPAIADTGKYIMIWKLQPDGVWRIFSECWNSNRLLPMMQK